MWKRSHALRANIFKWEYGLGDKAYVGVPEILCEFKGSNLSAEQHHWNLTSHTPLRPASAPPSRAALRTRPRAIRPQLQLRSHMRASISSASSGKPYASGAKKAKAKAKA